jgi:fructose-bisphosphate aldolase class 1
VVAVEEFTVHQVTIHKVQAELEEEEQVVDTVVLKTELQVQQTSEEVAVDQVLQTQVKALVVAEDQELLF